MHILLNNIHGLSNTEPPPTLNTSITFSNKIATIPKYIANCFSKQLINTVNHATHKTNISINRATHKIQGYNITLTTTQVQEAIQQCNNNNSQGPDKLNIRHLKHIGPLGVSILTNMFKTASYLTHGSWLTQSLSQNPTQARAISLLSVIATTLEKSLLPYITANIPNTPMQHGYKTQHYSDGTTHTKLHRGGSTKWVRVCEQSL